MLKSLATLALLAALPAVAFWAISLFYPAAQIVGPYLFASPLLACMLAATIFSHKYWSDHRGEILSKDLTDRAAPLFDKAGLNAKPVFVHEDASTKTRAAFVNDDSIWVNLPVWEELSQPQQDFVLAQKVAELLHRPSSFSRILYMAAWVLIGGAIAAVNPWLILVTHSATAVWFFGSAKRNLVSATYRTDRTALRLTGSIAGALSYLQWEEKLAGQGHIATIDSRRETLKDADWHRKHG